MEFANSYIRPLTTGGERSENRTGEYFPEYSTFIKIYKFSLTVITCCFKYDVQFYCSLISKTDIFQHWIIQIKVYSV